MGHTRLGKIPTTRRWQDIVGIFASAKSEWVSPSSAEFARLADSTAAASAKALRAEIKNGGLAFVFYLLTQLALSARRADQREALHSLGLDLPDNPTHLDLTVEAHRVIDEHFRTLNRKSDVAEMAQLAFGETISDFFLSQPADLFANSETKVFDDLRSLGSQRAFGAVARSFFATFMGRLLGFYLSKFVIPGGRQQLVKSADDLTKFNSLLRQHAYQRAAIVHEFAEKWFSKTEFERGIDPKNTRRFIAHACKKLEAEFMKGMSGR